MALKAKDLDQDVRDEYYVNWLADQVCVCVCVWRGYGKGCAPLHHLSYLLPFLLLQKFKAEAEAKKRAVKADARAEKAAAAKLAKEMREQAAKEERLETQAAYAHQLAMINAAKMKARAVAMANAAKAPPKAVKPFSRR